MRYDFVQNDTGSALRITCLDDAGAAIDITGAALTLLWRDIAGVSVERSMSIIDAAGGVAEYQFAASELFARSMTFTVRIVDALGGVLHSREPIRLTVRGCV